MLETILREGVHGMNSYIVEKRKTPKRFFWRLCLQTAGAIGVFFMVMALFGWTSPQAMPFKQAVRECFTTDTDVMPVIEWLNQSDKYNSIITGIDSV